MALGDGIRRDVATISPEERQRLRAAFVGLTREVFPGRREEGPPHGAVSFWFKQDEIHQATHVHGGPGFLPWHRELCNRLEEMLRLVDPAVSLHYWDWTTDPRRSPDLFTSGFMGRADGPAGLAGFDNGGKLPGSRNATGNAADPPQEITRNILPGAPAPDNGVPNFKDDATMITSGDMFPVNEQYREFRLALEAMHNDIHANYIRGTIGPLHSSFEDPFVFLLHSNVDRLFAMWQLAPGHAERLDPGRVYGDEGNSTGREGIVRLMEPWAGNATGDLRTLRVRPWAPPENEHVLEKNRKNAKHPSVVRPPLYDFFASFISLRSVLIGKGLDPTLGIRAPMGEANLTSVRAFAAG